MCDFLKKLFKKNKEMKSIKFRIVVTSGGRQCAYSVCAYVYVYINMHIRIYTKV